MTSRSSGRTPVLRVRFVRGLKATVNARAMALVWDNGATVVDAKYRSSRFLDPMLWHESKHHEYTARFGMTERAGWRNMVLDVSAQILDPIGSGWLTWVLWMAKGRPKVPWVEV